MSILSNKIYSPQHHKNESLSKRLNIKKIYRPTVLATSIFLVSTPVIAATEIKIVPAPADDQASELVKRENQTVLLDNTLPSAKVSRQDIQQALKRNQVNISKTSYDLEALKSNPRAFTLYLNRAIAAQDMQTVKELLPHYKALQVNDPMLIAFADALVLRSEGKNKQAIAIYKNMLAKDPDFNPVRLNLAQTLYADKQYVAAEDQLRKLQAADVPDKVKSNIAALLSRIETDEDWRFATSLSYVEDDNLNDVPAESVRPQFSGISEPESGHGVQLSASATKRHNLPKNYYATIGVNGSLKGYWDNPDYNDYLLTASAGLGYDDAKNDISMTPFFTKRIYDEQPYSLRKGVTLRGSRWIKPKLKLTGTAIFSNEEFDDEKNKNRETDGRFIGLNALYTKDAKEYFYGGLGTYRNDVPKSSIISYDRHSLNIGWGREWAKGISTLATADYSIKKYDSPLDTYSEVGARRYYTSVGGDYGTSREDKTYALGVQVWKRDFALYGVTPRLVFDYEKTSSNFKYYDDRDEKSATVLLTKSF